MNGIDYYIPAYPIGTYALAVKEDCSIHLDLEPVTVIRGALTISTLRIQLSEWLLQDDVISSAFLSTIFLPDVKSFDSSLITMNLNSTAYILPLSGVRQSSKIVGIIYVDTNKVTIPNGPYFVSANNTHIHFYQAYRLYRDYTNSFMYGIVPTYNGGYETLRAAVLSDNTPTVAVPSRLYYTITNEQPLAGMRVAVKDIFDIAGTKRGCGSRAYFELYPIANITSFSIRRLIDKGAILVGKAKTSQFGNGELATADWIDYHCPFNPRADGYEEPLSSSSGSAASIAAYHWLDIAIRSDTGGSVREPAAQQGLFAIRPSHDAISLDGVMALCSPLDVAGFFARNATLLETFGKAWYEQQSTGYSKFPTKILYSTELFAQPSPVRQLVETFANKLVEFLGAAETTVFDISSAFSSSNITNIDIETYYNETYTALISHYQYYNLGIHFINDFRAKYDGRNPFINPVPSVRWQYGSLNVTNASYEDHLFRKQQFSDWWNGAVQPPNSLTCSENIFLYSVTNTTVSYRNKYLDPPKPNFGFKSGYISSFAGNPDIVVPIGEVPYNSTITMQTEYFPVTISLMAHAGCDYMLLDLMKSLATAGVVQTVKTGKTAF